jgi:PAS domain S-box-containing protein
VLGEALIQGGPYTVEYRVAGADGELRWASAHGRVKLGKDGKAGSVSGVVLDDTHRKRAESKLRESEHRFGVLAECIPQMIWTATPDGALDYVSGQTTAYFGWPSEALLGAGWLEGVHADDQAQTIQRWQQSLATGEPYETAFRLRRGRDATWRWHLARALPLFDNQARIVQWFGTCTDIQDQKVIESELTRVNKELEEFAYVASHDLQEPLRMVNIYTQLILDDGGADSTEKSHYAGFVREGVRRMEGLIHDLLTFSKAVHSDQPPVGTADLSAALREAISVLKNRMEESGCIVTEEPLPWVRGDASQMAHVFQNLLSNALKYCKRGVPPAIHVSAARDGNWWVVGIRDNGIGFEQHYAERIFGLFKRLHKEEYPGTGLGLAICKRIVERYGGRIWAEGRPGEGSTFYFSLPRAE